MSEYGSTLTNPEPSTPTPEPIVVAQPIEPAAALQPSPKIVPATEVIEAVPVADDDIFEAYPLDSVALDEPGGSGGLDDFRNPVISSHRGRDQDWSLQILTNRRGPKIPQSASR